MHAYDEKYIKAKVRNFSGVIKRNLCWTFVLYDEVPKENEQGTCIACITINSVMRIERRNYLQFYLEECKYRMKKTKMTVFIESELETESESES